MIRDLKNRTKYEKQLEQEVRRYIESKAKASGELARSTEFIIQFRGGIIEVLFISNDYYYYIDNGRKPGKMPPIEAIKQWTRWKGIPEKAAWPIAKKIAKVGYKARTLSPKITDIMIKGTKEMLTEELEELEKEIKELIE